MSFSACHTVNMNTSAPDPGGNAPPLEGGLVVTQIPIYTLNGVGPGAIPLTVGCQSMRVRCPSCKGEVDTSLLTAPTRKTHLCAMTLYICCCWPFVCLPYFINYCKNVQHYCPNCGHFIGSYSF